MSGYAPGEPRKIAVAGDWHGNTRWAERVIWQAAEALADEEIRILLHLGDFGFWHGSAGDYYLQTAAAAARRAGLRVLAVRGNHENPAVVRAYQLTLPYDDTPVACLPDGRRWTWHGRTWVAAGGAVSPDRIGRTEGVSWWPEEELSQAAADGIAAGGKADVLVSHDVGSGVHLALPPWPDSWHLSDLTRGEAHRERMQGLTELLQPRFIMHGHYHRAYERECDFGYGPVRVTGLDMDGTDGNWAVLDICTMEWERNRNDIPLGSRRSSSL